MSDLQQISEELHQVDILVASNKITRSVSPETLPTPTPMPQMARYVALILANNNYSVTNELVTFLAMLAVDYFHDLSVTIKKLSEIQRRTKPSLNDVRYAFKLRGVSYNDLYQQALKNHKFPRQIDNIPPSTESHGDTSTQTSYEIAKILPNPPKPRYVPAYLPDFPPQFTFQSTPDYMPTITDPEKLRIKLVEESRLTEKSLYGLIGDEKSDESDVESIMSLDMTTPPPRFEEFRPPELPEYASEDGGEDSVALAPLKPEKKSFDVLKYVQNRLRIKQNLANKIEEKRDKRKHNIYMEAERYLSPYAEVPGGKFGYDLEQELDRVIHSVKAHQKRIYEEVERLQGEKRQRREEMENKETIEFNFHSESEGEEADFGDFGPIFEDTPVSGGKEVPETIQEESVVLPTESGTMSLESEALLAENSAVDGGETGDFDDFEDEFEDIMGEDGGEDGAKEGGGVEEGGSGSEEPKIKFKLNLK